MRLINLSLEKRGFPPIESALNEPNGLLAFGGDLSPSRLMTAYQSGIFPWYSKDEPILWWSPDPRAVLLPSKLHLSRSLRKELKKNLYKVTLNKAFSRIIANCAIREAEGTWITLGIQHAYLELHLLGYAHSFEVWLEDELVGGLYGIAVGKVFCGESMFSFRPNASKYALIALCRHFQQMGGELIDCQILNSHTASLGAYDITRKQYIKMLYNLKELSSAKNIWQSQDLTFLLRNIV